MSSENQKNSKILEKDSFLDKILSSKKIINPKRDWTILIILFFISLVFVIVFDAVSYYKISSGEMYINVSQSEIKIEKLKKEKIEALINNYETKKEKIHEIKNINLVDPSI